MKILKLLNNKYLSILLLIFLSTFNANAEDKPIDIWNIDENEIRQLLSLFISNAIAVGNSDLTRIEKQYTPNQCVLVYDNQPRNKEIRQQMIKAWEKDFPVVVWPKNINEKDINEMTMNGHDVQRLIQENVYSGTSLFLEISRWSRC